MSNGQKKPTIVQHFVPQYYLKKFCFKIESNEKRNGKYFVYMYNKEKGKVIEKPISVKDIGQAKKFYDIPGKRLSYFDINPESTKPALFEDNCLNEIDGEGSTILNKILEILEAKVKISQRSNTKINNILNSGAKKDVLALMMYQLFRTRKFRKHYAEIIENIDFEFDNPEFNSVVKAAQDSIKNNLELHHLADFLLNEPRLLSYHAWLNEQIFLIGINNKKQPFITSDHPVMMSPKNDKYSTFKGIQLKGKGLEIYFPLSPKFIAIILEKTANQNLLDFEYSGLYFDLERVDSLNKLQFYQSDLHLYSSQDPSNLVKDWLR